MKFSRIYKTMSLVGLLILAIALSSCGPTRSYWGVESEYNFGDSYYPDYGRRPHKKHHKHHKKHHGRPPRHHGHDWHDD